jgi:hypothetical protein
MTIRKGKLIGRVDNSSGIYTCKDCGTSLESVFEYSSPKGQKTEINGQCPNEKCVWHNSTQTAVPR